MSTNGYRGLFLWHQLNTPEPAAAADFYREVVGWGTEEWGESDPPYTMFTADGVPVGGLLELSPEARERGAPPHWLGYLGTPDVDATVSRAGDLGAAVTVPPEDIPSVGRFAVLRDPQGAYFAAYTPDTAPEDAAEPPGVGRFSWHELATTDPDAAFDFYAELFGWEETSTFDMGEMGPYRMYGAQGLELGGIYSKPEEMPGPPAWLYYARVAGVDGAAGRVRDQGGRVVNGPLEVPGGDMVAQCTDPQGGFFALHEVVEGDG